MDFKDYYQVLGVNRGATAKEIKSAYRKLAKAYHPDIHPQHADKFKDVSEAYEVLGDESKRKRYDAFGSNWKHGSPFQPGSGGGYGTGAYGAEGVNINFEDMFGGGASRGAQAGGFSDFFESLFGAGASSGGAGQPRPRRSQPQQRPHAPPESLDVEQPLHITLREAIEGGKRTMFNAHLQKELSVSIPAGIRTGKRIRVKGAGKQPQRHGQLAGDLYLKVTIDCPKGVEIQEDNIVMEQPVPLEAMILGGDVSIELPSGKSITITIAPFSQTGQKLRIKGAGLPSLKGDVVGHVYLKLMPKLPVEGDPHAAAYQNAMQMLSSSTASKL
jgi:curved DNA-binding protein